MREAARWGARAAAGMLVAAALVLDAPAARAVPLDVDLVGLDGELDDNVRARLTIQQRRKEKLTEPEIRELHARARQEIGLALEPFGYYRPRITATLERDGARWEARYEVSPGPPLPVDSTDVRVTGAGAADPAFRALLADFPLARGQRLDHAVYEAAKDAFVRAALKHGYLDGRFERHELRLDLERYVAAVVLHYATGPQYRFGPVSFRQDAIHPDLLAGYVGFERGAPLDFNRLLELEQALGNSPFFSRVEVRPRRDLAAGDEVPIVVELTPARSQKYTAGAGYGTDNGPHVRAAAELRRINRRGHRGKIEGTLSAIEQSAVAEYVVPWPYPRTDVLTLAAGYSVFEEDEKRERAILTGPSWARIWAGWQQAISLVYRREDFRVGLDQGVGSFLVLEGSWSRFRANDPVDPSAGRRLRYRINTASDAVLSDATYLRLLAEGKWIRSVGARHRLIGRVAAGRLWTRAFHDLPPSARFFAGGSESVRGFGFQDLGRRDAAGNVIGGELLATAGIEYELRLLERWGAAIFYDAGNAMRSFATPLEHGAGIGVRWVSPIGLVGADLAVPLSEPEFRLEFHLTVGPPL